MTARAFGAPDVVLVSWCARGHVMCALSIDEGEDAREARRMLRGSGRCECCPPHLKTSKRVSRYRRF